MKKVNHYIGLDVHKERTTYVVRDKIGNIILEGEAASLYTELVPRLKPYLRSSIIGLEASTSYYTLYQQFLKHKYNIKVSKHITTTSTHRKKRSFRCSSIIRDAPAGYLSLLIYS